MKRLLKLISDNQAVKVIQKGEGDLVTSSLEQEAFLIASGYLKAPSTLFVVKPNAYEAQKAYSAIKNYLDDAVCFYPYDDSVRYDMLAQSPEMIAERLNTYEKLLENQPCIVVTHVGALMHYIPSRSYYLSKHLNLMVGMTMDIRELQHCLINLGYQAIHSVDQPFYFSHRGGIVDVYSINYAHPIRIEFFDDEIDSIRFFDEASQRTIDTTNRVEIIPATEILYDDEEVEEVITSLRAIYDKCSVRLDSDTKETLLNHFATDMENLRHHDTSLSMTKYYAYFKHSNHLLSYVEKPNIIMSYYSEVKTQERLLQESSIAYQLEMFEDGRMIRPLDLLMPLEQVLKKQRHVIEVEKIQSKPEQVIFNTRSLDPFYHKDEENIIKELRDYLNYSRILIVLSSEEMIRKLLVSCDEHMIPVYRFKDQEDILPGVTFMQGNLPQGFELGDERIVVLTEYELFGVSQQRRMPFVKYKNAKVLKNFEELQIGDYVVHDTQGIGQYLGIQTIEVKGALKDYLRIAYRDNDQLFVPLENFKAVRKYTSKEGHAPKLNKMGTTEWAKTKQKIKKKTDDLAGKLVQIYAERMMQQGFAFQPDDQDQLVFEQEFGYELTPDQQAAVDEIKHDMEVGRPMDRLLCGDVGFGKTEVALRAAFKAIEAGKQVALLCPTTVLASQHYRTAVARFASFAVEIAMLSRHVTGKQEKDTLQRVKEGKIDLLIGTHRILSKDVEFKDIGLLIVDEEQRFGVKHKETIKELKKTIDVLTLTATPIPRTLQMSLMGIRGLSTINTPPQNRYPVQTFVLEKSESVIKQAIERELARGGQVFYLYNRTEDIHLVASQIERNIPGAKVAVGHGKMDKRVLENVMNAFINQEYNVLVCTTIIETGIDIPNANTMLVEDADHFGLAQLYQIKGRVGRSSRHAYAYLMYRPKKQLTEEATRRLTAIKEFTQLGSGYKIAMRDLNIRGAGDILGGEQAGFIDTVGYDMFMRILQESIDERTGKKEETKEVKVQVINNEGYIPENYVSSDMDKIRLYQQLAQANDLDTLDKTKAELVDLYGRLPREVNSLVEKREFDILCDMHEIAQVKEKNDTIDLIFNRDASSRMDGVVLFQTAIKTCPEVRLSNADMMIGVRFPRRKDSVQLMNSFLRQADLFIKES